MQNVALLLTAVGSLISAFGGVGFGLWSIRRGSQRERQDAAAGAAERMLSPNAVDTLAVLAAIEEHYRRTQPAAIEEAKPE